MKTANVADIFGELISDLNEVSQTDVFKNSVDSLKSLQKQVTNTNKLMTDLAKKNDLRGVKMLKESADRVRESQVTAAKELMAAKEQLLKIDQESNQKAHAAQVKNIQRLNQQLSQLARESVQMQKNAGKFAKGLEHNLVQYENLLRTREERIKELGTAGAIMEEKFAKRFESSVSVFTSGIGDLESFGKAFQGSLGSFAGYLSERAGKAKEKAAEGKGTAGMANMLKGLSQTMGILAVAAGSVMALVSLFKMAEESVIGANKKLVEGSGLIDMMAVGAGSTAKNLEEVRDRMRDADFATSMGMAVNDTIELVTQFQQLNIGIKQFGGGTAAIENMKEAMKSAKGMSMGLGISMDEASQYMAKFAFDLGVSVKDGSILNRMAGDFADIRDMALQSSYSTANFFKKVMDLTDQLENMNYRTKEAGTLVLRFASVLGKSGLDKALQSLFSGFRSEGYLEQMKRNMMSKSKEVKKALRVEAIKFGKSFQASFGGKEGKTGMMEKLMKDRGVTNQKDLIKNLASLDNKGRQDLFSRMKEQGGTEEFTDQLYKFIRLARGTKKNATAAEVQGAQEEMGAGGNLKTKFAMLEARIGDRDINDAGVVTKEMLTKFGINKEQIEVFGQLQTTMKGDLRKAQALAKGVKGGGELTKKDKEFLTAQGLDVTEDGKLVMAETREAVGNFSDYLQAQDEAKFKELKGDEKKTQEQYLDEGVKATTSVFDALNNTIAGILNDISKGIYNLVGWFFGGNLDSEDKEEQQKALRHLENEMATLESNKADEEKALDRQEKLVGKLATKPDSKMSKKEKEELKAAQDELKRMKSKRAAGDIKLARTKEMHRDLTINAANFDEVSGAWDTTSEEFLKEARQRVLKGEREKGKERGELKKFKLEQEADLTGMTDMEGQQIKSYDQLRQLASAGKLTDKTTQLMLDRGMKLDSSAHMHMGGSSTSSKLSKKGEMLATEVTTSSSGGVYTSKGSKSEQVLVQALKDLKAPTPLGETRRKAVEDQKARKKENIDQQVEAMKKYESQQKEKELQDIATSLGIRNSPDAGSIAKRFKDVSDDEKYMGKLRRLAIGGNESAKRLLGLAGSSDDVSATGPTDPTGSKDPTKKKKKKTKTSATIKTVKSKSAKDFWIDSQGNLWKIDPGDLPSPMGGGLAMTKPGGAVEGYVDERFKKMGNVGGVNVTVNVNGGHTNEQTGMVVATAVKKTVQGIMGGVT